MEIRHRRSGRSPRRARLLVVDGEPEVPEIVARQMVAVGHSVPTAQSGAAAPMLLDGDASVDMIVSDLSMPGMDGVRLGQEVQQRRPRLPAIILTGLAANGAEDAFGHVIRGPFAVLHKPVNAERLADRVAQLLSDSKRAEPDLLAK
jgi:DNA-binding NtrC family response regulator